MLRLLQYASIFCPVAIPSLHSSQEDPLIEEIRSCQCPDEKPPGLLRPLSMAWTALMMSRFLSFPKLPAFFLHLQQTKIIAFSGCLHLPRPLPGMPVVQITVMLILTQHLCLTSNITSPQRPSQTTRPFPSSFHKRSHFIFLPKTYQTVTIQADI